MENFVNIIDPSTKLAVPLSSQEGGNILEKYVKHYKALLQQNIK